MPRNVVTLSPRLLVFPQRRKNRETRQRIEEMVVTRFRARVETDPERIEMDFPKAMGSVAAKQAVIEALDATDARWRRVFELLPYD